MICINFSYRQNGLRDSSLFMALELLFDEVKAAKRPGARVSYLVGKVPIACLLANV
jgi:hypothetical protein